jgi:hypothetical protein
MAGKQREITLETRQYYCQTCEYLFLPLITNFKGCDQIITNIIESHMNHNLKKIEKSATFIFGDDMWKILDDNSEWTQVSW